MNTDIIELIENWAATCDDVNPNGSITRVADNIMNANNIDPDDVDSEYDAIYTKVLDAITPAYENLDGWIDSNGFYGIIMNEYCM